MGSSHRFYHTTLVVRISTPTPTSGRTCILPHGNNTPIRHKSLLLPLQSIPILWWLVANVDSLVFGSAGLRICFKEMFCEDCDPNIFCNSHCIRGGSSHHIAEFWIWIWIGYRVTKKMHNQRMEPTLANAQFSCLTYKAARLTRNVLHVENEISISNPNVDLFRLYDSLFGQNSKL